LDRLAVPKPLEYACKRSSDASDPSERGYLVSDASDASDAQMQSYSYENCLSDPLALAYGAQDPQHGKGPFLRGEKALWPILAPPSSQVAIIGSTMTPLEQVCKSASDASDASDC
jgi:hypothetical protein